MTVTWLIKDNWQTTGSRTINKFQCFIIKLKTATKDLRLQGRKDMKACHLETLRQVRQNTFNKSNDVCNYIKN